VFDGVGTDETGSVHICRDYDEISTWAEGRMLIDGKKSSSTGLKPRHVLTWAFRSCAAEYVLCCPTVLACILSNVHVHDQESLKISDIMMMIAGHNG
jgi:hypothetical protein